MDQISDDSRVIAVRKLEKKFGYKTVLRRIDLSLIKGEFLTLFGPNGAGKTTLIHILCGLMRPSAGRAFVAGFDTSDDREAVSKTVGVISHNPFLYPNLTAYENLKFYGMMYGVRELNARIKQLIGMVGLEGAADERVQNFSRGMQQRLSVARAIIHGPEILFLDEPFTGLDQHGAETFWQILLRFRSQGKTVIMTSHDLNKGLELCNRAAILNSGKLVYDEQVTDTIRQDFKQIYLRLTEKKPLPAQACA
jgi:heme exporter protein A